MAQRAVSAWIQYSRRMPPGCGLDLRHVLRGGGARALHPRGGGVGLVEPVGAETSISSPPIVHSSATPPASTEERPSGLCRSAHEHRNLVRSYCLASTNVLVLLSRCPPPAPRPRSGSARRSSPRPCGSSRARASPPSPTGAWPPRPTSRCRRPPGTTPPRPTSSRPRCTGPPSTRSRGSRRSPTGSATPFDVAAWADELADWLHRAGRRRARGRPSRSTACRSSCSAHRARLAVHREWGRGLRALGDHVLRSRRPPDRRPPRHRRARRAAHLGPRVRRRRRGGPAPRGPATARSPVGLGRTMPKHHFQVSSVSRIV